MRPCYWGELGCGRFVPITVPLSTNISSWPFRANVLSAGSRRPLTKHHLVGR